MKRLISAAFVAATLATPAWADFNSGVAAYARGDFETAAQQFIPLAETANDPFAQRFLGDMYAKGKGVDQDMAAAAKWYKAAAEKGVASAQCELGLLYRDGNGVPKDLENSFAWLSVANKLGSSKAPAALSSLDGKLSAEEMASAQKLAEEYIQKYGTPPKAQPDGTTEPIKVNN